MATQLRFLRGMIYPYTGGGGSIHEFLKILYEFWGYCVNGTSALQTPGGMANTMSVSYSVSNVTGAGVSPIVITTTSTNALVTGMQVNITGVQGATAANGQYQITVISTTQFSLNNTTGNGAYTGGGTVNTTAFACPTNFTEGTPVLAVGNDGYTAAQVSTTTFGDAIFTAATNQPFSSSASTLTVNQATNYQTTIAAGSNGFSLPQSTINVASTITASTTIAAGSNGVSLPTATINVASNVGFPSGGYLFVVTTEGIQLVTYTGLSGTTQFTGCSGGIGSMTTGGGVSIAFPPSGTVFVTTNAGVQTVTYTGTTGTTFTGCSGGSGLMSTGGAVYAPIQIGTTGPNTYPNLGSVVLSGILGNTTANGTWTVTTPSYSINNALFFGTQVGFPSNGASLPQATINSNTQAPFCTTTGIQTLPTGTINVTATAAASTTINGGATSLPSATITVLSTTGFPTSGTINVSATVSTTIALGSNGASLPTSTINVASTAGFPTTGGTISVTSSGGPQVVTYTGVTGTSFIGCSGGTGTLTTGNAVSGGPFPQVVTYTGTGTTTFTGCSGGTGSITTGNAVNNTGFFTAFPSGGGQIYINTTTGAQLVNYTGVSATTFTGCTGGSGNTSAGGSVFTAFSPSSNYTSSTGSQTMPGTTPGTINVVATSTASTTIAAGSNGQSLPQTTINAASVSGFAASGIIYVTTSTGVQVVNYTGVVGTATGGFAFTGCTGGNGNMSTGGAITAGFPSSGYAYALTTTGYQTFTYTGTSGTSFTGCVGGSGSLPAGSPVFVGYPPTGTINIQTSTGVYPVTYTGTTATTFTGGSGGSGAMSTGGSITSPITVITTTGTTLLYGQTVVTSGIVGLPNSNSTFAVTPISNNIISLGSGALGLGAYISGGTLTDHQNFVLNNSVPNGNWTSGGTQQAIVTNMVGKALVIWKPNSGTSEDSVYIITSVIGNNQLKISLNTGGTPDPTSLHPSFTQRSNINYRVVALENAFTTAGNADGNYITLQFNPSLVGINPGQANSQVQLSRISGGNSIGVIMSPGGNWNGITFPVTGNYHIDATSNFGSQSGGVFNGTPNGNMAITIAADPAFFWMHYKDINSGDGSSYIHVEIPTRLYPQASDTNPMVCLNRGGVFNGSVFGIGTSTGQNYGRGFVMKGTDGVIRAHYSLAKSLSGDASPIFGSALTDFRLAFNTSKGFVLASDILLHLPGVIGQFTLGRVKLRTIKFTSTPLPLYHRFGIPGGNQYLNIQNGCAVIWDNTILPANLFFII